MSEWQEVRLRECISTLKGFAFKSKWYQPDGVPIVRVSDFTDADIKLIEECHIMFKKEGEK